ncbi:Facilitated glucose transporter-like [Hondaea fermentalgiana]|uniref:Hexose transporter 1 n=1 Tax=Hondaea fermentalgiana TaxID=2315210 RepID=A0A2R5GMW7_9STRA|nr:Facilitated glucose transporter-like [Hondaea fermentalgiana]|eukprot:GBG32236.1 Facilitated glucose transporter-like [Hondaea fermentalgiana]
MWFAYVLGAIGLAGGAVYGYNVGASAYLDQVAEDFALSVAQMQMISSMATVTDAISMLVLGNLLLDKFGRRNLVAFGAVCNVCGAVLGALADRFEILLVARAVSGVANGINILTVPMLVAESAPLAHRGLLVSLAQVGIVIGFTLPYVVQLSAKRWQVTVACGGAPGAALLLFLVSVWSRAESKAWLASRIEPAYEVVPAHGNNVEAQSARESDEVDEEEFARASREETPMESEESDDAAPTSSYEGQFGFYGRCALAVVLAFTNNASDAIIFYGPQIIQDAGMGSEDSLVTALIISAANIPAMILVLVVIERFPRRMMLLWGLLVIVVAYVVVGLTFLSKLHNAHVLVVGGLLTIMMAYQVGPGTLFLVVLPELFVQEHRAKGMAIGASSMSFFSIVCNGTMLSTIKTFGPGATFLFYSSLYVICLAILVRYLPESKNVRI